MNCNVSHKNGTLHINGDEIKTVIFDGDNTIIDLRENITKALDTAIAEFESRFTMKMRPVVFFLMYIAIVINDMGILRASETKLRLLIKTIGILLLRNSKKFSSRFYTIYDELYSYIEEGNRDTKQIILQLKLRGYKVLYCSNNSQNERTFLELSDKGDIYIPRSVSRMFWKKKIKKPELLEVLLIEQKVDPKSCLIIGDSPKDDISSGKQYGLHTLLFNRTLTSTMASFANADIFCKNLKEIEKVLFP